MTQEIRWHYRFRNFSRAYSLLRDALDSEIDALSDLEKEGVIQRFEYTFELSWNTLKDRRGVFARYPGLTAVRLFGSYATGRATPRSDIDLATVGLTNRRTVGRHRSRSRG